MAAKKKMEEDEAMKARKRAKMVKDMDEDEGEDMACSDDADEQEDEDEGDKKAKRGKKLPWMKSKKKAAAKSADDDEDMDEDEDGDGEEGEDMDKSETFLADKLEKALDYLRDFGEQHDDTTRRDALFAKAHSGARMNKSERAELLGLIDGSGDAEEQETLGKSATAAYTEEAGDTVEISDFLNNHHEGLKRSLAVLGDEVEALKKSLHSHNIGQARVLVGIGEMVKSMAGERQVEMQQPARAPKGRGVAAPLEKSFGQQGSQPVNPMLVKSALNELVEQSYQEGREGMSKSGYDLSLAMTMYESSHELNAQVAQEVKEHLRGKA